MLSFTQGRMPQTPLENVVTHWHKLIENFQTSPKDFYAPWRRRLCHAARVFPTGFLSVWASRIPLR